MTPVSLLAVMLVLGVGVDTARAEVTAFGGVTMSAPRAAFGLAAGGCPGRGCWEIEYARTVEDSTSRTPGSETFGGNFLVRFKSPVERVRFYGIGGLGIYNEVGEFSDSGGAACASLGGGAFVSLGGRLKVRLEYRLFLPGSPDGGGFVQQYPQRLSAGLSISFR
jgi:hypothetical protein